ncbi:MAG: TPM domain-containing protein [Bacteroidales bacterium]|nr:TPM domain-containing protein [Bacteroidales bacterium]MCF8337809.1 TPM domain-containing protein [Bacteroidales bacterium]
MKPDKLKLYFFTFIIITGIFLPAESQSQVAIPDRPSPPKLVNDFTSTLNQQEKVALERKLVRFNDTSSTQITVVIVSDFNGQSKSQFAYKIGEEWGVGQKEFDNGLVILLKPKEVGNNEGEVFIATGYGVEGAVPDAIANRITEEEMIPEFKKGNYYAGLDKGTDILMKLTAGEYSAEEYQKQTGDSNKTAGYIVPILAMIIVIFLMKRSQKTKRTFSRRQSSATPGILTALLLFGMGGRHSGSWNNFSSGGGSFGGDAGGFGGFGGGSFGGGGAGGSW